MKFTLKSFIFSYLAQIFSVSSFDYRSSSLVGFSDNTRIRYEKNKTFSPIDEKSSQTFLESVKLAEIGLKRNRRQSSQTVQLNGFEKTMLDLHNEHRKNAGVNSFQWSAAYKNRSSVLVNQTLKNTCTGMGSSMGNGGTLLFRTTKNLTETEVAVGAFTYVYMSVTKEYDFPGETKPIGACFNNATKAQLSQMATMKELFNPNGKNLGCEYGFCGQLVTNSSWYLYAISCSYDVSQGKKAASIFTNKAFFNLCKKEPGSVRSCDANLDNKCKALAPKPPPPPPPPPTSRPFPDMWDEQLAFTKVNNLLSALDKKKPSPANQNSPSGKTTTSFAHHLAQKYSFLCILFASKAENLLSF